MSKLHKAMARCKQDYASTYCVVCVRVVCEMSE